MSQYVWGAFGWFNQNILRNTKEDTVLKGGVITILKANLMHALRTKLKYDLQLQYPNDTLKFPLPNRWSNHDISFSKQQLYMVIKQVGLNLKPAGEDQIKEIREHPDISKSAISVMQFLNTLHLGEMENIDTISKIYNLLGEVVYTKDRELLFADSMINGDISYMLRKYGVDYYEIPESKQVDQKYRTAFEKALQNELWNDHASKYGLSKEQIIKKVKANDGVYTMLYEHMEQVSKGNVIKKLPQIYCGDRRVQEVHYLHIPYPVFLRVETQDGFGYICIAIGFRYDNQPTFFSPFFARQGERVWRLAQSHMAQMALNDFTVRVHLGVYHFTTNQYHVPIYRFMDSFKDKKQRQRYHGFLRNTYSIFSRGLEGVNVAATASLVHQIQKFSLVNKALNIKQEDAVAIIAGTSNNVRIFEYNPETILKNQGIPREEVIKYFQKMSFDLQLYDILSEYIQSLYNSFGIDEFSDGLLDEINNQTKKMKVGVAPGTNHRPLLRNKEDVLQTIKNLCFCWVGFHSHTFSIISLATYALLRPSMLKTDIPKQPNEWQNIEIGTELPHPKVIMQTGKLNEATTQRDVDNYLIDTIRRQAEAGAYLSVKYGKDKGLSQAYGKLEEISIVTLKRLQAYENKIVEKNRVRREKGKTIAFEWMLPSKLQSSLNI